MKLKNILQNMLIIFVLAFSAMVWASEAEKSNSSATNVYTEDKLNITVDSKSPEFTIKLKSNPTTGFSWFLREYDAALITPVKYTFQKSEQKLAGAPGYEIWTFRVKPVGFIVPQQTVLRMIYARPWQGADSSTQIVFRVTTQGK